MPRPIPYSFEISADTGLITYALLPTSLFRSLNQQSRCTGPSEWQTPDHGVSQGSCTYHPPHHTSLHHRNIAFKTGTFILYTSYYPLSYITPNPSQSSGAPSEDKRHSQGAERAPTTRRPYAKQSTMPSPSPYHYMKDHSFYGCDPKPSLINYSHSHPTGILM
jgi:hypothetical protein